MTGKKQLETFGQNLKRIRHSRGFTQGDVSRRAGSVSQSSVTQIENDRKEPTLGTILGLAKALDVPPSRLVDFSERQTIDVENFTRADAIEDVDAGELRKAMVLIKELKRLGIL